MYKKYIITNITNVDPTINDNIAAGYTLGQEWFNELTGEKFLHKSDGVWLVAGIGITEVTYDELLALKTGSELVANQTYLLTDYETTYGQPYSNLTINSGIIEPLYITATDVDKLSNECKSELYPQDIVYYEITGDINNGYGTEGFTKGKIYRRIDTLKNNDIGTDWRHITYRRWAFNVTNVYTIGTSYVKGDVVTNASVYPNQNAIYVCFKDDPNSIEVTTQKWVRLPFDNFQKRAISPYGITIEISGAPTTIPVDPDDYEDTTMLPNYSSPYSSSNDNKVTANYINNNIIYSSFSYNNIYGAEFENNTLVEFYNNNIGRCAGNSSRLIYSCNIYSQHNGIGLQDNMIHSMVSIISNGNLSNNIIWVGANLPAPNNDFRSCSFKEGFTNNIITSGVFYKNEIGISFSNNIITDQFYENSVDINFNNNALSKIVKNCKFGTNNTQLSVSNFDIVNWNFGNDIDGSTIALPNIDDEYTKKLVNANGTYIIEYIDEYGDDIIADQLETLIFRSNQELLNIIGFNYFSAPISIDWGDASKYSDTNDYFDISHIYLGKSNSDEYEIRITGSEFFELRLTNNQITFFDPINLPSKVSAINLGSNLLTNFNPSFKLPSLLSNLNLNTNLLTSFDPSIALPNSLGDLNLNVNQIASFDPSIALPINLQFLYLGSNQLTSFDPVNHPLPSDLLSLGLENNQLTSFDPSIALPNSLGYLYLSGNQITNFDPVNHPLPTYLVHLNLENNQLTSFDPINHPLPSNLNYLLLKGNQLTSFDPTNALPSSLYSLVLQGNQLTSFDPVNHPLPSGLNSLLLWDNQLTSFDPVNHPLPSNLNALTIGNNLTVFDPSVALPTTLKFLYLNNNSLTVFDPSIILPNIEYLYLLSNNLTVFNPSIPLPISLNTIDINGNQLNTTEVNNTLVMLNARYTVSGVKTFDLRMSPSAPPSGVGITAKLSLMAKGYTVYTN